MSRWEPDAKGRLGQAAMELYVERGFEQTTVADIAERAGLTERTFFRHFVDKREVLFAGQDEFQGMFVRAIESAPTGATPLETIEVTLSAVAAFFEPSRSWSMQRAGVINSNPALLERELIKLANLKVSIATTLRERGMEEPAASLTAETAVSVFHITFRDWTQEGNSRTFAELAQQSLAALKLVTAGA